MATIKQLEICISEALGLSKSFVGRRARLLREAGFLPLGGPGRGGVNAADASSLDAARMLLVSAVEASGCEIMELAKAYASLPLVMLERNRGNEAGRTVEYFDPSDPALNIPEPMTLGYSIAGTIDEYRTGQRSGVISVIDLILGQTSEGLTAAVDVLLNIDGEGLTVTGRFWFCGQSPRPVPALSLSVGIPGPVFPRIARLLGPCSPIVAERTELPTEARLEA